MPEPNWKNRTLWTGDNLSILRGLNSESVDLIYLDPPFNSNRDYEAPIGSPAEGSGFKDTWTLDDVDIAWLGVVAEHNPLLADTIALAGRTCDKSMQAYLTMMSVRLIEMRRVLKDTGSIYLHCDAGDSEQPGASHYLKLVMDCIFSQRFPYEPPEGIEARPPMIYQNELAWKRTSSHSDAQRFAAVSDRLLFYAGEGATWTTQYLPLGANQLKKYRHKDKKTGWLYRPDGDLTGDGTTEGESGAPWNGYDPTMIGRHWAVPKKHGYAKWLEKMLIPGYRKIKGVHARLDALDDAGLITWTKTGTPQLRRYLVGSQGEAVSDFISDIPNVNHQSKEWNGYKTQKPLKLLERLILSSTNEGDMVLDPFCGCATTLVL